MTELPDRKAAEPLTTFRGVEPPKGAKRRLNGQKGDTTSCTIRVTVLGDPHDATFSASKFVPENRDLGSEADAAVEAN
jgi:hypothetical protein